MQQKEVIRVLNQIQMVKLPDHLDNKSTTEGGR